MMFWKAVMTLLCIAAGVALFDWTGRFHMVVGLPVLALVAVLCWKLSRREDDEMEEGPDMDDEEAGIAHDLFIGTLRGAVMVGVLALAFIGLSSTPLRALIEGPDCRAILGQIDILAPGRADARIVEVVDASVQRPFGPVCQQDLLDRKVRALLALAEAAPDARRLEILKQAPGVAVQDTDLMQLVASRLQAEKERLAAVQKHVADADQLAKERAQRAAAEEATRNLQEENDQWKRLLETFKRGHFTVEETPEGIKVILSEQDALRFAPNKADLDADGRATVGRIADLLMQAPYHGKRVRIIGHTDATGHDHGPLSRARATSVAEELVHHGIREDRLDVRGVGAEQPMGDNATLAGRAKNRRVEIVILKG
jgi:outer membrane protein OmpA-like peptidoglycan-associated protein